MALIDFDARPLWRRSPTTEQRRAVWEELKAQNARDRAYFGLEPWGGDGEPNPLDAAKLLAARRVEPVEPTPVVPRNKKGHFLPGFSGNPKGRPRRSGRPNKDAAPLAYTSLGEPQTWVRRSTSRRPRAHAQQP